MRPAPIATLAPTPAAELLRSSFNSASEPPRQPQSAFGGAAQHRGAAVSSPAAGVARPGDDLLVEDDFDEDFDAAFVPPPPRPASARITVSSADSSLLSGGGGGAAAALSSEDARQIKDRLFGKLGAPPSWKQGFFFNTTVRGLEYGLVQKQGGPCGILAAVQAQLLAALTEPGGAPRLGGAEGSYTDALVDGIAASLWRAAQVGAAHPRAQTQALRCILLLSSATRVWQLRRLLADSCSRLFCFLLAKAVREKVLRVDRDVDGGAGRRASGSGSELIGALHGAAKSGRHAAHGARHTMPLSA
jgi:hypothetical protein